ncbi:UNVERIFIED_CONTAM: hypothetical protein Slati_0102200 [Sesamum latifolium]|uniref:Uncharacterized protein n=1 Tax=Sesamum latifolium TaxID=2727402 RepID=A0AAW2Y8J3_9LAMI
MNPRVLPWLTFAYRLTLFHRHLRLSFLLNIIRPLLLLFPAYSCFPPLLTVPTPKPPKLHLPPFDGSAPLDWMFQADQYFSYHQVPSPQRLAVILFYIQGEAISGFKWLYTNQQLSSWMPSSAPLSYVLGLRSSIIIRRPFLNCDNAADSISVRPLDLRNSLKLRPWMPIPSASPAAGSAPLALLPTPPARPGASPRRLAPIEMQAHRAQGLYFNCDEKFGPRHRCKARQFLLLMAEDPDPPDPPLETPYAFSVVHCGCFGRQVAPHSVLTREHDVTILIDSSSSHNIVQPHVADYLGLPVSPVSSFPILVGNGDTLHCSGVCSNVPLQLQSHPFSLSLYVIPIFGADIVLDVQWLATLGPFLSDYFVPSMQFYHQGRLVHLTGILSPSP